MKKLILLLFLVALVFVYLTRDRLYIRDPLGSVARDGVKEAGTQVFINVRNEVLLENDNAPMYVTLVQVRQPQVVGIPQNLRCIHWVACLADADVATLAVPATPTTLAQTTGKVMEYTDASGKDVVVTLR